MNSADERVWDLLQTIDLENLDITTFQGVAAPIFAQKENKEALEALALIAFARMARQGEFNGWLNAGGGGAFAKLYNPKGVTPTTYTDPLMQMFAPMDAPDYSTQVGTSPYQDYYWWFPFYAQGSGKITDARYRCSTVHSGDGTAIDVGFYTSDDNGQPATKIGTASLDMTTLSNDASATITETSTDSMTLTQGELYWVAYKDNGTTGFARTYGIIGTYSPALAISDLGTNSITTYNCLITSTLPATYSASDLLAVGSRNPIVLGGVFS